MKYIDAFDFVDRLYSDAITDEQRKFAKRVEYAMGKIKEEEPPYKITISIPKEFICDWEKDCFEDALQRLIADAHCLAGNYEKETARMLIEAFKEADVHSK